MFSSWELTCESLCLSVANLLEQVSMRDAV